MKAKSALLALLISASSAFAATTTTVKFCNDSSDGSNYTDNRAASGWSFTDIGADDTKTSGTYSHPVKFKGSTRAQSASTPAGSYLTQIDLGVWIGNTARTVTVTPLLESGSSGTAQTATPSSTSGLIEMPFSFTLANCVTGVTVSIAASGNSTAYLYYATVTTDAPSGGGNTAPVATQPSVDVDATVGTEATVDLSLYFTDADGDQLSFALVSGDGYMNGSVWSFTPDYEGSFSAEVSATDPSGDSATMTINVTVAEPSLMPLSAPWIEYVYPEDVSTNGFVLRWMDVDNAVGYDLVVTNVAEQMEVGCQVSYSGPNYPDDRTVTATVTGLDPDTLYAVAVRALADPNPFPSSGYSDSDWSTPVEIATTIEGGLQRAVLLDEGFSGANNAWGNTSAKPGDAETDCDSWSFPANVYNARSSIKIGGASAVGWALSPEITLSNEVASANIVLSFSAAAYPAKSTKFSVSIVDSTTGETNAIASLADLSPTALSSTSAPDLSGCSDYEVSIFAPTRFKLLFETISSASDKRLLLDSIKVTQVYDPNYAVLPAPTGVAGSDVGKYGFTVSWTGVANATGYEVWLDGASHGSCASTDTSMELTGLSDGTEYSMQVKALGDNLHYGDSLLSTAVTVTTLADAQKIDFTVTGAPAGDVFAGDAVSFTVTAENESTHTAAEVAFSGIAGATFTAATGAFSWTPTESDVGSHTATFTSGTYSTNVTITVVSATTTRTLATENFSKISSTSWTSTSGYATEMDGDIGTWTGHDLIKTKKAVILGRGSVSGTIVSPAIDLPVRTPGSLSVSFDTGSLPGKKASVQAQILDAADDTVLYTTNFPTVAALPSDATAVADAGARFTVAPGANIALSASIRFSLTTYQGTGDDSQRAYVDTVVFTQTLSAKLRDLDAPTGLAVVGDPGETGFTVGWTAVANATNYAVRVTDAAGAVVFSAPFCAVAQATVTGLADDEVYSVKVRATGDEAAWTPSPWTDGLAVRTARSALHPTLSFGEWVNAVGDGKLYAGVANTAAVSAVCDNGSNAVVTLTSVLPAPTVGPTLEDNVLAWTPVDTDTNKTFTISFLMDGDYATNVSCKVLSVAALEPPTVNVKQPVEWDSFELSWNSQYRAAGYAVRVWTDCPNPAATATRMEESFAGWPTVKPAGWSYHTLSSGYKNAAAPVAFDATGDAMETYDLGGPISSVSFHAAGHSIAGSTSALTVVGIAADGTETVLATLTVADIGQTAAGIDRTYSVPAGVRKIAWRYTKDTGGIGVGSVVIEGTGFSTARWLPGWGPAAKDVGLVQGCTVAHPRPGTALGVDPADKSKDLFDPRSNYAEVTVHDASGASFSAVVEVDVPAPPRSVRATLMVLK